MSSLSAVYVIDPDAHARQQTLSQCAALGLSAVGFATAEEFLSSGTISFPGCIVTELELPGLSGLELQARLAHDAVCLPFVFLTGSTAVSHIVRAMKQGAVTVLAKSCPRSTLETAIRDAVSLSQKQRSEADALAEMRKRLEHLSLGERQVLDLILDGQTNKAIAKRLDVAVRTVEARRQQIFRKTNTASLAELVKFSLAIMNATGQPGSGGASGLSERAQ